MIGSTVGHYDIVRKIGGGGMGVVYLARDTRLDRPVALKFVRTPRDPGGAKQLLREARAASAPNHPGICTVHEVGESGSDVYIVMDVRRGRDAVGLDGRAAFLVRGRDCHRRAGRGGARSRARSWCRPPRPEEREHRVRGRESGQSARLRPVAANLVAADDITRPPETLTEAGVIAGTLAYMSPELLRGGKADERADLWPSAVTLFEMCASRRPFEGATPFEMSAAILGSEPPPLPPHVPAPLGALVTRALSKDPGARFPTAAAFRGGTRRRGATSRGRGPAHSRRPAIP